MMAAELLRFVVLSRASSCCSLPCSHACSARAFALHFAQHLAKPFHVQMSCLERIRPTAAVAFAGRLAAISAALPGRPSLERKRQAKAEGKIKGRGTMPLENPVCTWGWRGTRRGATACRESAQSRTGIGKSVCFIRLAAPILDGASV
ncbi:hypothetical protein ACQCQP_22825 [Ralstonia pseudosolanacearum]|uniref:hypothetical protein n=1 Tax=Ralstonia pseudosolanacearum TaxID=1310165 RepID=UPI0009B7B259|nr:hypothetical protein [Ralstonia pseudosolanacearum]QKZ28297.1 hypothetical protein HWE45_11635 [Ralstonia solanacearum]MCK4150158.1 hypothetical protein [Ralstonia pseudosolanacearum]QKZ33264.1 hypothetical protein HWE47_11625 [Ralstonia solanacearum]QMT09551.1 hypothetical protein H2F19_11530 [Ralstonia solanacearum]BCL87298.1 hypothetical protein MAFF211471_23810 [Ralstonia solanacearum]